MPLNDVSGQKRGTKKKADTGRQAGKKRAVQDGKPKRPPSAYMLWLKDSREQILADNPGINPVTGVAKIAGAMWRNLEDRREWDQKALKAKADYDKAMKEFNDSTRSTGTGNKKRKGAEEEEDEDSD